MNALDLGDIYSKLRIDFSELEKAEVQARKFSTEAVRGFGKTEKAGQKLKKVGTYASGATLAITGFGVASFNAAKNFGDSFSDVQKSVSDLNDSNVDAFKQEILEIGQRSLIGANGVAQLVAAGGKLGESSKGALEFAKASEQIAVAFDFGKTVEDAQRAGEVIGNLRSSFGLSTEEVLEFADAFNYFGDTTASNAKNITDIMARQGATISNATNLSKGELAALAASFDSVAPSAEVAATGMKNMILSLAAGEAATSKQKEAMEALGFSSEELAARLTTDATGAILDLLRALGNVDETRKAGLAMQLFGRESIGAISPLIANLEQLEDNFKRAGDSSKFLNSVSKEYDRLNNADNAKFTKAINSLQVSMIKIGDVILPILAQAASALSNVLSKVNELDPGLVKMGVVIAGVAAAVGPVLLGVGSLVVALAPLVASAGGLSAAFSLVAAAAGPVGIAIAAIAAGAVLLYQNWDAVVKFFQQAIASIVQWFNDWANNSEAFQTLIEKFAEFKAAASEVFDAILGFVVKWGGVFIAKLNEVAEMLGGWDNILEGFGNLFSDVFDLISNVLGAFGTYLISQMTAFADLLNGNITVWEFFGQTIRNLGILVKDVIGAALDFVIARFESTVQFLKDLDFAAIGKELMNGLARGIKNGATAAIDAVKNVGTGIVDIATGIFDINSPSKVFQDIGNFTMSGLAAGIIAGTSLATAAAEEAAVQTVEAFNNAQGGGGGFASSFSNSGFSSEQGNIPGFTPLSEISNYYDERLALLQQKGLEETQLFESLETQKQDALVQSAQVQLSAYGGIFDSILSITRDFAGEQSGVYRAVFAVSKAFAIAEAAIALGRNVAQASAIGFPQNIPFIAGAFAQGATIASTISSVATPSAGAFYNGGNVPSGMTGIAGEKGVEIVGPAGVMSTQKTKELLSGGGGGGDNNVFIEIINNMGANITTEGTGKTEDDKLKIYIDRAVDAVTSKISQGGNKLSRTLEQTYKIGRGRSQ